MTNTDTRKSGSDSKDPKNNNYENPTADNKTDIKLERGEELYSGFGFDDQRPIGDKKLIRSISESEIENSLNSTSYKSTKVDDKSSLADNKKEIRPLKNEYKINKKPREEGENTADIPVSKRLLKEDSVITIEANNGSFSYQEETFLNQAIKANHKISDDSKKGKSSYNKPFYDYNIAPNQWPADYELEEIYYGKDQELSLLVDGGYQEKNLSIPSIKTHYKSMEKNKKNKLSLGKMALGLTALGTLAYILLSKDDDTYF